MKFIRGQFINACQSTIEEPPSPHTLVSSIIVVKYNSLSVSLSGQCGGD